MELQAASNQFCGELYKKIVDGQNGNVVMSPLSIQTAVSLAYFGATGETAHEMKTALKYDSLSNDKLADLYKNFVDEFKKNDGFKMATKMVVKSGCAVKSSFKEVATNSFDSEAEEMDFANNVESAKAINEWIEGKTNNKIKNLLSPDNINDLTMMILVNAIHFKGEWDSPFNPSCNFTREFYLNENDSVQVEFMGQRKRYKYGKFEEINSYVVEMNYKDSDAKFMIFLPISRTGLADVEAKLSDIDFNDISSKLNDRDCRLHLPKFKIELQIDLNESLKKLGIQKAFRDDAEFDGLLESSVPLKLSKAVHKSTIEVNELGTEASAATWMGIEMMSMPKYIFVDHPFLFVLKTKTNVVFIGRCCEPKM